MPSLRDYMRWQPFSFRQAKLAAPKSRWAGLWLACKLLMALIGGVTLLIFLLGLGGALWTGSLQKVWNLQSQIEPIRVLDRSGNDLGVLDHCDAQNKSTTQVSNPVRCRESLTLTIDEMPRHFLLSYLAKEDVRYFQHPGIDFGRVPRSLLTGAGGSTVPMQLLKNNVLAGHFDYDTGRKGVSRQVAGVVRKATEYVLAPLLSARYSKAQVLEMSVNSLPWLGIGQRRGLHDAARIIFGKQAADLSLAQSAFLVGLLPRPSTYLVLNSTPLMDSTEQFRYMRQQQLITLDILRRHALITADEYAQAASEPLQPSLWQVQYVLGAGGLTVSSARRNPDYTSAPDPAWTLQGLIKQELHDQGISPSRVATVSLSIDAAAQRQLSRQVTALSLPHVAQGAAIVDVHTGGIVALASSTGGELSTAEQQWAVTARRPVASTVKPLLYATAFERGLSQDSRFTDKPTRYYGQSINNNNLTFLYRPVTIREANARSLNTVAVQVGLRYEDALTTTLKAVGYSQDSVNRSSPALGTWRSSPLGVAAAYASFGNGGQWCRPYLITAVYGQSGQRIALPQRTSNAATATAAAQCKTLWSQPVATQAFDMLRGAVSGPYSHVQFLRPYNFATGQNVPLGAKSGTTDNVQDSWCAGVTPQYAMSVWLGDPAGMQPLPDQVYQHQVACRNLGLLRVLPYEGE